MEISEQIILDTDFLSYFLIEKRAAILKMEELLKNNFIPVTTAITKAEMYFGARKKGWGEVRMETLERLFASLGILDFTRTSAEIYGEIRANLVLKGVDIGFADTAIASIAFETNSHVLTNNLNHFKRIDGLKVLSFD